MLLFLLRKVYHIFALDAISFSNNQALNMACYS